MASLRSGDLRPYLRVPPPGPRARAACARLAASEAPGINTLYAGEPTILWQEARGANVLDVDGNRYVDLTAGFGVAAVGHRHPAVVAAVRRQAARLLHALGDVHGHPARLALAEALARRVPVPDARIYFATSGAEAVEVALKTALLATGRASVLAFDPAYHGLTLGALAATSRPEFRAPFSAHLHRHLHRLPYGCPLAAVAAVAERHHPAAVLVEPMVGREGMLVPPAGWLAGLAELCRQHGMLLIADEIFTGFGRTGRWFAVDHDGVQPDLLCCGKALGGGLPIAAVAGRARWMAAWTSPGEARHTSTFLAPPLSCVAALATLEVLAAEGLAERAAALGSEVGARLAGWPERLAGVRGVRGQGLAWGIELDVRSRAAALSQQALAGGLLVLAGGPAGTVVQLVPPLTIHRRQLFGALETLESILRTLAP